MKNGTIGLIDIDLLYTKNLTLPNYELCSVATHYKLQGKNVRLIVDLTIENLIKYEKIYVFKSNKKGLSPEQLIKGYYRLQTEEYGEGMPNRPLIPDIEGLIYINPTAEIYYPLVNFIQKKGKASTYKIKRKTWFTRYQLIKCFYQDGEELLTRGIVNSKKLLIYDDPVLFFETDKGQKLLQELLQKKHTLQFATPLDIIKIRKEHYELLMTNKALRSLRNILYASENTGALKEFLKWCEANKDRIESGGLKIEIDSHPDFRYSLMNGLRAVNELPERVGKKLRIYPQFNLQTKKTHFLLRYFSSWQRKGFGSFYEYVIWRSYSKEIDRHRLRGQIDPYTVEFLFKHYGVRYQLSRLEQMIVRFPEAETLIMRGGKSYYGTERSKYSLVRGASVADTAKDLRIRDKRTATFGPRGIYKKSGADIRAKEGSRKYLPSERAKRDIERRTINNYKRK